MIARGPFDPDDARTVVELELVLEEGADLGALAAQGFRIEVDRAGELRIYDPVVTCWVEAP